MSRFTLAFSTNPFRANDMEVMVVAFLSELTITNVIVEPMEQIFVVCELQIIVHHHQQEYLRLSECCLTALSAQPFTRVVLRLLHS